VGVSLESEPGRRSAAKPVQIVLSLIDRLTATLDLRVF
jgi:hypothetical protein